MTLTPATRCAIAIGVWSARLMGLEKAPAFHREPAAAGGGQTGCGYFTGAENGPRAHERCLPGCGQKRAFVSPVPAGEGR